MNYIIYIFLILPVFLNFANTDIVPVENECTEHGGKLLWFYISECTSHPCKFSRNKPYNVTAQVSPGRDSEYERVTCGTRYWNGWQYKPVSLHDVNGCDGLIEGECPVEAGQNYTYSTMFSLSNYAPIGSYYVRCSLIDDQGLYQACGGLNVQVVY